MRQVNLLPDEYKKALSTQLMVKSFFVSLGPVLALFILVHMVMSFSIGRLEDVLERPIDMRESPENMRVRAEIDRIKAGISDYYLENQDVIDMMVKHYPFSHLLTSVGKAARDKVWLKNIEVDSSKGFCHLDGQSLHTRLVSEFMLALRQLPYFKNVELVNMDQAVDPGNRQVTFRLKCFFKG